MSGTPLGYLDGAGVRADHILPLTWFTLLVSIVVCMVIGVLLWLSVRKAKGFGDAATTRAVAVEQGADGRRWISIGLIISAVPLLVTLVWTFTALAQVGGTPDNPGLVLDVTAHQWWWQVQYNDRLPAHQFTTANEIHIPIGVPVLVRLHGADVIHSFWAPKLSGKMDAIPGRTNQGWLQADAPGRYLGQCSEFCGFEHARMRFEIVAQPRSDFDRWRAQQLQTAPPPVTPAQAHGLALVEFRCGLCHSVRGTNAGAVAGPDLTHLMSRRMIAAGALPNNPATLSGWILDPQSAKPGALMPPMPLSGPELADVRAYLETLR
jgi:cytochrome c oxidase subunit II